MLPREQQLPILTCVCAGVYGIERITLERPDGSFFDVTLASIELQQQSPPTSPAASAPFYSVARDWLRRQLIGTRVTFSPVAHRVGYLYAGPDVDVSAPDADSMMVNAQLVRQGYVIARTFPTTAHTPVNPKSAGEKRKVWFKALEDEAREKGLGLHGVGRLADAVRITKPFPESNHPYNALLVHHLQFADAIKFTVESVTSPILLTCVNGRSSQEIQVRICGITASRVESYFQQSRVAVVKALLHREVVLTFYGFDSASQTFWARIASQHNDVYSSLLERGLVTVDDRCAALPKPYMDPFVQSQSVAQAQRAAVWSSTSMVRQLQTSTLVAPPPLPVQWTGQVQAVSDEASFELVCTTKSDDGNVVTCVHHVSLAQWMVARTNASDEKRFRNVDAGAVVSYSPKSFFGREALRRLLIGEMVRVTGRGAGAASSSKTTTSRPKPVVATDVVILLDDARPFDVVKFLTTHFPAWYAIPTPPRGPTLPFPLVASPQDVLPLTLLRQTLLVDTGARLSPDDDESIFHSLALDDDCETPGARRMKVKATEAAMVVGSNHVDILYVQTPAQLQTALRMQVLPLGTPLSCLVEAVDCWVDASLHIRLRLDVYLTAVGAVVPVALEGIQLPFLALPPSPVQPPPPSGSPGADKVGEGGAQIGRELLDAFSKRILAFLHRTTLHREGSVSLIGPNVQDGSQRQRDGLALAVLVMPDSPSLTHALVECGFGVPSGLLTRIPVAPSCGLIAAEEVAQAALSELWSPSNSTLLASLDAQRVAKTGLQRVPRTLRDIVHHKVDIVPLTLEDHETFTYRLVSDQETLKEVEGALRAARHPPPNRRFSLGDIVAAPFDEGGCLRAKIVQIESNLCSVEFLDVGTVSPLDIPLSVVKTFWKAKTNVLAKWKPLARRARHALIDFTKLRTAGSPLSATPATAGELAPAAPQPHTITHESTALVAGVDDLSTLLVDYLFNEMDSLMSFPQLSMYVAYEKEGVDHVLLKPPMESLDDNKSVTFELSMWEKIVLAQRQLFESSSAARRHHQQPTSQPSATGGSRRHTSGNSNTLTTALPAPAAVAPAVPTLSPVVDLDYGCVEFPALVPLVVQFMTVRDNTLQL